MTICKRLASALLLVFMSLCGSTSYGEENQTLFDEGMRLIETGKLKKVADGVDLLIKSKHDRSAFILESMLESKLYRHKKQKQLVMLVEKNDKGLLIADLDSLESIRQIGKRKAKRIPLNNKLRGKIKGYLASQNLNSDQVSVRKAAIQKLLGSLDAETLALIKARALNESNPDVQFLIDTAIALDALQSENETDRLKAIPTLSESLEPSVRNQLTQAATNDTSKAVQVAALSALEKIEDKIAFYGFVEKIFFGLSLGSVLVLAAIGLAITFGVMGCINMAHGELIMIGAYTTYVIQLIMPDSIGASLFIAVPTAFVVSGLVGIAIERGVIQFLKGRPLETLLATFGISLVLQQAVRSIFSPLNRSVETPDWMAGSIEINPIFSLTLNRLYIILFCLAVFAVLFLVLKRTVLGLQVRAVSQNRSMARAMGVRSEWVDALTFGLGSGIAGVAGVALSQLTNVGPNLGQSYIIDSFMVVVFGGVGNLWGTLVAGMSLGVANKMLEPVSGAVLAKIFVLVFIILFIQKKPRGLFPQKGRAAEG